VDNAFGSVIGRVSHLVFFVADSLWISAVPVAAQCADHARYRKLEEICAID
jgi:hypothetical protein